MFPVKFDILFEELENKLFADKGIRLTIARLDKIHPVISGNKIFKLHYFIQEAITENKAIITFGGAYSNHLVATAYACKEAGLACTGIVRGDKEANSHTLEKCTEFDMELKFTKRNEYYSLQEELNKSQGDYVLVPEGGYHPLGAKGAALIMNSLGKLKASHICLPVGTATTIAGLIQKRDEAEIVAIPVIRNMTDLNERINFLNSGNTGYRPLVLDTYHFGGYAKNTDTLLEFMNHLYNTYTLPTDFVYTAKMMFGIFDSIENDFFSSGSHIVAIHTGGLQGNLSLPPNTLTF